MKVWVFVEGRSDVQALAALWGRWMQQLRGNGCGVKFTPLDSKPRYLNKIGHRVAEKLVHDKGDVAIGLPDFFPNRDFANTVHRHDSLRGLQDVQTRLVRIGLKRQGVRAADIDSHIGRFYPSAMKHDMEVLVLSAPKQLQARLDMSNMPGSWRQPPEEQNQDNPPKKIVERLFSDKLQRRYRGVTDSVAILENADLNDIVMQCPTFRAVMDWIGEKTGVPAY